MARPENDRPMAIVHEGDRAPAFTLPALDGPSVSLDAVLDGSSAVVLVFLRHLG